ncbi:MAG: hypothetical protein Q7U40_10985 [Desulfatirhabdiaceae bacterium]|nr:hypothetical protein [Desulfatirhabdiaceae bacterium]
MPPCGGLPEATRSAGGDSLPDNINPAADVDGDGKIGMAEAIYAMQKVAGL